MALALTFEITTSDTKLPFKIIEFHSINISRIVPLDKLRIMSSLQSSTTVPRQRKLDKIEVIPFERTHYVLFKEEVR